MKIKIGLLIPYSGVFRNLRTDLKQGLDLGLSGASKNLKVEYCAEFIQMGESRQVEQALRKLIYFENADLIVGMVGTKVILEHRQLFEKERIPVIINNLGAYVPTYQFRSEYLFYNSLHLWKSQWAMGRWAQQQYGGEPALNMSIYESGYHLQESFRVGASAGGAKTLKYNMLKNDPGTVNTEPLLRYIEFQKPNQAHILLSGKEGEQFLQLFKASGLGKHTALTVNPFMAEDNLAINPELADGLINALTWAYTLENEPNYRFTRTYETTYNQKPNVISLLSYETGLALKAALEAINQQAFTKEALAKEITRAELTGPRGKINLATTPLKAAQPVYIRRAVKDPRSGMLENKIIATEHGVNWDDPGLLEGAYMNTSGWQNPYLCV